MNRGYLLPKGCTDLLSFLESFVHSQPPIFRFPKGPLPPVIGEITIEGDVNIRELAEMLRLECFQIRVELLKEGIFVDHDTLLDFNTITVICRKHGYVAMRPGDNLHFDV